MPETSTTLIDVRLACRRGCLSRLRQLVGEAAEQSGFSGKDQDNIVLAVNEACANIIKHVYHYAEDEEIRLLIYRTDCAMVTQLHDDADCVDQAKVKSRDLGDIAPGGLGVHFIHEIMDETAFLDSKGKGNILQMVKLLKNDRRGVNCTK